jgi:protein gp37
MAETTIEWTRGPRGEQGYSFNAWTGCQPVSPCCDNCYAAAWAKRAGREFSERRRTTESYWRQPIRWNADAAEKGTRYRVFCSSLADVFDNQVPTEWRADLFKLIASTPNLDWLLLTKRIGNAGDMIVQARNDLLIGHADATSPWPWPNVWLGATIGNREEMLRDGPKLAAVPAHIRFWSVEPMLGPLGDIPRDILPQWVITGAESGPKARPTHPEWVRGVRDQCVAAGVAYLHKQNGEWLHALQFTDDLLAKTPAFSNKWPNALWDEDANRWEFGLSDEDCNGGGVWMCRVGKKAAGRLLDGRTWDGFPA